MIHYRFSLLDSKSQICGISPDIAFETLYSEDWFKDPWVMNLLEQVEHCKAFGRNMISLAREDVSYPAEDIGQGVKCLITAHFEPEFYCNIDHIGENLYQYLDHFTGHSNIHLVGCLNPYHLAQLYTTTFPPMYLEDFDKLISSSEEFQQYFYEWSRNNRQAPLTYRQLTNWNRRLRAPIHIDTSAKIASSQKQIYGAKFSLYFKMNFIQAQSSEGKTFLLKRLNVHNELQQGFNRPVSYKTYVLRKLDHLMALVESDLANPDVIYLVLVDMDRFSQSISVMDTLLDTPDNFVFLFVGHHMTSYIKIPLPSIYSCHLDRHECKFDVHQSCLVDNSPPHMLQYDTVVTEDIASGYILFAPLAKDIRHALPAGGFGGIKPTVEAALRIPDSQRILVVMDYVTSVDIIPQLSKLDKLHKLVDVIVPTSSEYCLAYVSDKFDQFMHLLQSYHSIQEDRLLEELYNFDKRTVTSETLDLLAFSQTFGYVNRKDAKAADVAVRVIKYPERLPEMIKEEKESLKFDEGSQSISAQVSDLKSFLFNKE